MTLRSVCVAGLLALFATPAVAAPAKIKPPEKDRAADADAELEMIGDILDIFGTRAPRLPAEHKALFDAVLEEAQTKKAKKLEDAWKAFEGAYFNEKTERYRTRFTKAVIVARLQARVPEVAEAAQKAARAHRSARFAERRAAVLRAAASRAKAGGEELTQLQAKLDAVEAELKTAADLSQMMQMDLQQAMQAHAKAMQVLSNILKSQHETSMAIIGNMK